MRYSPGSNPTFFASFTDTEMNLKDPDTIYVDVVDANGTKIIDNGTPVKDSLGSFHFEVPLPADAPTGLWYIDWQAVVNGANAFGREEFDVEVAGVLVNPSGLALHAPLRARVGEVSLLPADQNGSDTMFSTAEIAEMLGRWHLDLDRATLEAWERKAARLQRLIDFAESGTQRTLSTKFRQAKAMVDYWSALIERNRQLRSTAMAGRIPARVATMREQPSYAYLVGSQPNSFSFGPMADYTRLFPTHRLLIPALW